MALQNQHQQIAAQRQQVVTMMHILRTINHGNGDAMATASPGSNALQSWEHRPNGNSVAAQWWQVLTTLALASWQCVNFKTTTNDSDGNGNGSSNPM